MNLKENSTTFIKNLLFVETDLKKPLETAIRLSLP